MADIHDFIGAWHDTGSEETRELHEYLGMSQIEYELWLYSPRLLPALADARRTGKPHTQIVAEHVAALKSDPATGDGTSAFTLTHWLRRHGIEA
jgi:hypothetical protein